MADILDAELHDAYWRDSLSGLCNDHLPAGPRGPRSRTADRAYEAAKETSAIAARAQNLFALKACGAVVAIFVAAGLAASVMAKPDVTDRVARTAEGRSLRPVVSDGCDLAGAIPDCKKVMAKLAAGHRTGNDNGYEVP
jgi:hypothetical protein